MNSINTNLSAMVALQNLNAINAQLAVTQNRISTGLKVASAKDDPSAWAIAQYERGQVSSLDAVKDSLSRTSSAIDVAMTAGSTLSDLLSQLRAKALEASDTSIDTTSRTALNADFIALRNQIKLTIRTADFNGINLLDGSRASVSALAGANGTSRLTIDAQDMSLGGSIITLSAAAALTSATAAANLLGTLDASIQHVSSALSNLGTGSKMLDTQQNLTSQMQDTLNGAIGNLVDADMARESANLQALQVKQQLAIQVLSITNQSSAWLLKLFQ
ncbi:flagellin [Asticcacaulis sp. EMRT-3]|uniref:flagellin n=1 Tax=Asticcacaulis sp. EMRT-3 TaxID=3040349 RepID=UPI0024AEF614|nr:flagellin [Asticcacaulis sp. EMRT-3]MDI7773851.1 flagellin [Asticcacaulis sp. EMRT-3]